MLQVKNLTVTHKKDNRTLIDNLSFSLDQGDKMAVIGEEGNGKSTLLKCIRDPGMVESYGEISGEILTGGAVMGYLPQELTKEEREESVWEYMQEAAGFYETAPGEQKQLAAALGIPAEFFYEMRPMKSLSGGERVKAQLARIWMDHPGILLLDEPSNDLDLETLRWLEQYIRSCTVPVLYISHDEMLLERTANRILHMEQICRKTRARYFVTRMGYREYVQNRQEQFLRQEQQARKERMEYDRQQERYRQIYQKVEQRQSTISRGKPYEAQRLKQKMHTVKAMGHRMEREKREMTEFPEQEESIFLKFPRETALPAGKEVLDLQLPVLEVPDRKLAENLRLQIRGPEKVCIIGKNGRGKTTLLKKIRARLEERGTLTVGYMPQNYLEVLDEKSTPVDFLALEGDREQRERVSTYLGSLKFTREEMFHPIGALSGGQKAKLLLLQLSLQLPDVMLLDEPTRNFSPLSNPVIRQMLREYPGAIISVSHDRKYMEEVCDSLYELTEEGLLPLSREAVLGAE